MAISVTFYNFTKKKNSTKQPTGQGTTFSCVLKEPCTILNPVIELQTSSPVTYNYCLITAFDSRYYYVDDWESDHGRWIAHLTVDALASWRASILNSSQYVVRSGSNVNPYVQDSLYPMTSKRSFDVEDLGSFFNKDNEKYILSVSNMDDTSGSKINGLQYMIFNKTQMVNLMAVLLSQDYFGLGSVETAFGITFAVLRSICNPLAYIGNAYILPFTPQQGDTVTLNNVRVGWWTLSNYQGTRPAAISSSVNRILYSSTKQITINKHPQIGLSSRIYLNYAPYVHRTLYAGCFGNISLDDNVIAQLLGSNSSITINCKVDVDYLGHAILYLIEPTSGVIIERRECNVAIPVPLTQSKSDPTGAIDSVVGASVGAAVGGSLPLGITSGVKDAVDSIIPKMQTIGSQGSMIDIYENWTFQSEYRYISDDNSAANLEGNALCETKTLNSLSGYCLVDKPVLSIAGYGPEHEEIISYMSGGFFIE